MVMNASFKIKISKGMQEKESNVCLARIENSVPFASLGKTLWCQTVTLGTNFLSGRRVIKLQSNKQINCLAAPDTHVKFLYFITWITLSITGLANRCRAVTPGYRIFQCTPNNFCGFLILPILPLTVAVRLKSCIISASSCENLFSTR